MFQYCDSSNLLLLVKLYYERKSEKTLNKSQYLVYWILIKLLLSGKQLLLFMIIAWSLLVFVGYNVLTVEASTSQRKI